MDVMGVVRRRYGASVCQRLVVRASLHHNRLQTRRLRRALSAWQAQLQRVRHLQNVYERLRAFAPTALHCTACYVHSSICVCCVVCGVGVRSVYERVGASNRVLALQVLRTWKSEVFLAQRVRAHSRHAVPCRAVPCRAVLLADDVLGIRGL